MESRKETYNANDDPNFGTVSESESRVFNKVGKATEHENDYLHFNFSDRELPERIVVKCEPPDDFSADEEELLSLDYDTNDCIQPENLDTMSDKVIKTENTSDDNENGEFYIHSSDKRNSKAKEIFKSIKLGAQRKIDIDDPQTNCNV